MESTTQDQLRDKIAALSSEQRQQLLRVARSKREQPASRNLQRGFENWAAQTPTAIAVRCGTEQVTYAELEARATQIARALLDSGLERGDLVALSMDRGSALVAAMLGILKAGGAYLPIDPGVPPARQAFIREDARATLILTERKYAQQYAAAKAAVLYVDVPHCGVAEEQLGCGPALPEVAGEDLAYVIYTSGSTGQPKGVMVQHRNVVRLFSSTESLFDFSARDVWTLFHSYAFDFSVWEIWGALLYGGTLVVVPLALTRSARDFANFVLEHGVTVLNQTPSAFSNLMPALQERGSAGALRYVIFGGEALDPRRLLPWVEQFGDRQPALINMYGITETTVHVTFKRLTRPEIEAGCSDIGAALPDLRLYLLNERQRPVPDGVAGELYVGGAGVSLGYLRRPQLTAERFIPSPFIPGETLYKTGDLARRLAGGVLEYLGRNDGQVKLRGFRIELGDIEKQLLAHASVRDAVVAIRGTEQERQLIAYVVPHLPTAAQWRTDLLSHLRQQLPEYMVPARACVLDSLPLTDNGKVDRAALPDPGPGDVWTEAYLAPTTDIEATLCELYGEVLAVTRVGASDNFFSLGGDSLKTVNLVARAKARGLEIGIAEIFAHPCVAELALHCKPLTQASQERAGPFDLISAEDRARLPAGIVSAYPMSHMQQGMIYHNLQSADNLFYHNVINQRYRGSVDFMLLRRALQALMAQHDILRTSFHLTGYSEPLQLVHEQVPAPLIVNDLRALPASEQEQLIRRELARLRRERLVLTAPPLFAAHVFLLGDAEFELIWLEHHAILDGWSLASFMAQLMSHYAALAAGEPPPPPVVSGYYREFIAAERKAVADPDTAQFWQSYLAGAACTELEVTRSTTGSFERVAPQVLEPETFARCRSLAAELGVPLKAVLLAAYARVIGQFSNQAEVTVGITTHGRPDDRHSAQLLGLYVSTHPLRLSCAAASWRELIAACWDAESRIWSHRHFPLAEIKRLHGGGALFETTFTYNHFSITESARDIGVRALRTRNAFELDETGLGIACIVSGTGHCEIHASYNPMRFDAMVARRVQQYLAAALQRMVADVDAGTYWLDDADQQCVNGLSRASARVATATTLVDEFTRIAALHSQAVAAEQGSQRLHYAELERRSTLLAAQLMQQGVAAGSLVGLDCVPGHDMLVALLAVLKCGAAFVPLDAEQTDARLSAIVAESGLTYLIADSASRRTLPPQVRVQQLASLLAALDAAAPSAAPDSARIDGDSLAYVVYTSGSSGKPKGVAVTHGNVLSFLDAVRQRYAVQDAERVLQFSNIGFDIFIEELMVSIFSGGTLVLSPRAELLDPRAFWRRVASDAISFVSLPTAFWNVLCTELPPPGTVREQLALRTCVVGGDVMEAERLREWLRCFGTEITLWNSYGPAEATVVACAYDCRVLAESAATCKSVPIGVPLDNARCWVLDENAKPVPSGVTGELYLGGRGIARGYHNDAQETAARFLELEVAGGTTRVYRTGDLVRYAASGQLEFVGRRDNQLKIRGFRVELEEVRHAISAAAEVRQCVVVAHESDALWCAGLRAQLASHLPQYMLPSDVVTVESLPLTANGKVDRAALARLGPQPWQAPASQVRTADAERASELCSDAAAANPVTSLSIAERQQLLVDFNATAAEYPKHQLIQQLFEAQVAQRPAATALIDASRQWTYRELNERANRIAQLLAMAGVGREDRVAILLERNGATVAALLGVLKAGAAYVPLDPANTDARLRSMLTDCVPKTVLVPEALHAHWLQLAAGICPVMSLDFATTAAAPGDPDPTALGLRSSNLAYIIYTSGSTGEPKGVMIEHRSVINLWADLEAKVASTWPADARIGLNASLAFDASLQSLLQLLSGRCVVMIPQQLRADAAALCKFIARQRLTCFDCTPAQLQGLLEQGLLESPGASLEAVLVGGEAISNALWQRLAAAKAIRFFNVYGPTECTVNATLACITSNDPTPHLGRPLANTTAYILDANREPVPIGVCGELYLGGAGVGRGYWNRAELTAQRFLRDPWAPAGGRLYRTGDLARWLPDGRIEYLGRNDLQVKIRGFRIELGEIEARLGACEGVRAAVVVLRADPQGEKSLVAYVSQAQRGLMDKHLAAYVVLQAPAAEQAEALRRVQANVRQRLPSYMHPSAWVVVEQLPLTINGKVDIKALPVPGVQRSAAHLAPATATEVRVQRLWQDVLGHGDPSVDTDFFAAGGHSLLLTRLLLRVSEAFGVELSISELMQRRTIRDMASLIDGIVSLQQPAQPSAQAEVQEW